MNTNRAEIYSQQPYGHRNGRAKLVKMISQDVKYLNPQ